MAALPLTCQANAPDHQSVVGWTHPPCEGPPHVSLRGNSNLLLPGNATRRPGLSIPKPLLKRPGLSMLKWGRTKQKDQDIFISLFTLI